MSRTSGGPSGWDDAGAEKPPPAAGMRLAWPLVPAGLRQAVEQRLGGRVVEAVTQPGGFSPGVAARLKTATGKRAFVKAAGPAITKCILEVCYLTDEEIATACKMVAEAGIHYAKTSSGQFEGPSMKQFLLMRDSLARTDVKLKVAGVKSPRPQNAMVFLMAGADRIGTRAAPEIVDALDMMRSIGLPG